MQNGRILLANSGHRSFGWNLVKMEAVGKPNPRSWTPETTLLIVFMAIGTPKRFTSTITELVSRTW